jgi:hypothetical protein
VPTCRSSWATSRSATTSPASRRSRTTRPRARRRQALRRTRGGRRALRIRVCDVRITPLPVKEGRDGALGWASGGRRWLGCTEECVSTRHP